MKNHLLCRVIIFTIRNGSWRDQTSTQYLLRQKNKIYCKETTNNTNLMFCYLRAYSKKCTNTILLFAIIFLITLHLNESRGRVGDTHASYLGGPAFKSLPQDQLFCLKFLRGFPKLLQENSKSIHHDNFFHIHSNSLFTNEADTRLYIDSAIECR